MFLTVQGLSMPSNIMVFFLYNLGPAYAVKGNVVNVSHSLGSVCACLRNVVIVAHGPGFACAVQRIVAKVPRTRRLGSVCAIKDHAANVSNTIGSVFAVTHNGAYTLHSLGPVYAINVCVVFFCVWIVWSLFMLLKAMWSVFSQSGVSAIKCNVENVPHNFGPVVCAIKCNVTNFLTVRRLSVPTSVVKTTSHSLKSVYVIKRNVARVPHYSLEFVCFIMCNVAIFFLCLDQLTSTSAMWQKCFSVWMG